MAVKILAQAAASTIVAFLTVDTSVTPGIPGKDVPAAFSYDVTNIAGVAVGWVKSTDGTTFVAPTVPAPTAADLVTYANGKQIGLRDGAITVNVGSVSTPDEVNVASDANGRTLVTGCVQLIGVAQQAGQTAPTFLWINNDGTQLSLTSAQMMTIALKLGTFIQATYTTLGAVLAAIAAGTITTTAQIDALPASVGTWPATSY